LRTRNGVASLDDVAGHAVDAEAARRLVVGDHGVGLFARAQEFRERFPLQPFGRADVGQRLDVAYVASVGEIGPEQRADQAGLHAEAAGVADQAMRVHGVRGALDPAELEIDAFGGADLGELVIALGGALDAAELPREVRLPIHAVERHVRIQLERTPADQDVGHSAHRKRLLEPAFADVAPRADGIDDDVQFHGGNCPAKNCVPEPANLMLRPFDRLGARHEVEIIMASPRACRPSSTRPHPEEPS